MLYVWEIILFRCILCIQNKRKKVKVIKVEKGGKVIEKVVIEKKKEIKENIKFFVYNIL